jgi:hypothetical protein
VASQRVLFARPDSMGLCMQQGILPLQNGGYKCDRTVKGKFGSWLAYHSAKDQLLTPPCLQAVFSHFKFITWFDSKGERFTALADPLPNYCSSERVRLVDVCPSCPSPTSSNATPRSLLIDRFLLPRSIIMSSWLWQLVHGRLGV